jgi:hypothetical protein
MLEIFALEHEWLVTDFTWSPPPPASYFTLLGWRTATLSQRMPLQRRPFSQTSMGAWCCVSCLTSCFVSHVLHSSMLIDTAVVLVSKPDLCCGVLLV